MLVWNPSVSANVVGYKVYYGTASGVYTNAVTVSASENATITGLVGGTTYYFAATTVDASGVESAYSNEIQYRPGVPHIRARTMWNGLFTLTVSGTTGHTYEIEATQDLTNWTIIGIVTVGAAGTLDFTDTDTARFPQRFYRILEIF